MNDVGVEDYSMLRRPSEPSDCDCEKESTARELPLEEKFEILADNFERLQNRFNDLKEDFMLLKKHYHLPRSGELVFPEDAVNSRVHWARLESKLSRKH